MFFIYILKQNHSLKDFNYFTGNLDGTSSMSFYLKKKLFPCSILFFLGSCDEIHVCINIPINIFSFIARDIDEMHKIMDQAAEQKELADDLADLISNPANFGGQVIDEVSFHVDEEFLNH